jgi:predicted ATPase
MQSWSLLQLEPSALRKPDEYSADAHVSANGAHLPATLWRLGAQTSISNRLSTLLDDVGSVWIERDESRRTYTLFVTRRDKTQHPARSLSDGTLRFLALAIIAEDAESGRLLCLEEPENGIHPSRIQAILELLTDISVDANEPVSEDNPLRQVIINTHSPIVVESLNKEDLVMARLIHSGGSTKTVFEYIEGTWRTQVDPSKKAVAPGLLLDYLKESRSAETESATLESLQNSKNTKTVRDYLKQLCLDFEEVVEK